MMQGMTNHVFCSFLAQIWDGSFVPKFQDLLKCPSCFLGRSVPLSLNCISFSTLITSSVCWATAFMMASDRLPFNLSFNISHPIALGVNSQRRSLGLSTNSNIAWGALSPWYLVYYQICVSECILLDDQHTVLQTFEIILWKPKV